MKRQKRIELVLNKQSMVVPLEAATSSQRTLRVLLPASINSFKFVEKKPMILRNDE